MQHVLCSMRWGTPFSTGCSNSFWLHVQHYIPTLLAWKGVEAETDCSGSMTYVHWWGEGATMKPETFVRDEVSGDLIEQMRCVPAQLMHCCFVLLHEDSQRAPLTPASSFKQIFYAMLCHLTLAERCDSPSPRQMGGVNTAVDQVLLHHECVGLVCTACCWWPSGID